MANRNDLLVSIIVLVSTLCSCGGGDERPTNIDTPTCGKQIKFDGNNPNLLFDKQDGSVTASFTLNSGCYLIDKNILISNNATLIIEPQTTLLFTEKGGITTQLGNVIANGTADKPIFFTGQVKQPGAWIGIRLQERNLSTNIFNYVVIEYAGKRGFDTTRPTYSFGIVNINRLDDIGRVSFNNSIIRKSGGDYAFYAEDKSYIERMENNTIYDNKGFPIQIAANEVHMLNKTNLMTFNGSSPNQFNKISISGNRLDTSKAKEVDFVKTVIWNNLGVPYFVDEDLLILNTNLEIEAGSEIQFTENAGMVISQPAASLKSVGSNIAPIKFTLDSTKFTATGSTNSFWKGLRFSNSSSINNRIENTIIEYGGSYDSQEYKTNLQVDGKSQVSILNSKFRSSRGYGIELVAGSVIPQFSNNQLTMNQRAAAKVSTRAIRYLDATSTYTGNPGEFIEVTTDGLNGSDNWRALGIPYVFFKNLVVDKNLTIEAGAQLYFDANTRLEVSGDASSLIVNGASNSPVRFSSVTSVFPGSGTPYWQGIAFRASSSPANKINYAIIEYAGAPQSFSSTPNAAITLITQNSKYSQLELSNTTVSLLHSSAKGVFYDKDSILSQGINNNLNIICYMQC